MTKLHIADDLSLPIEAVTEALGFIGRRGSGTSYGAQKLAEEFHRAKAQFVALDPVGNWYGLRLDKDGTSPGLPIPVFGGMQGDIPIEPTAGKVIADTIVDRGISAIVDVSQFESDADKARFARAFCERFYFRKKSSPSAVHVFLEECQEFIPQNPGRDEALMLHAFTRLAKLGRNFGIGLSMISQRPQEVNKKVLNLTELLFVFQLTGVHERKAVNAWIGDKGIDEDIEAELPKLERGRPHVWSPAWLQVSRVISIAEKRTFDASSTPKVGAGAAVVRELSPIDLEKLRTDMAATIEKAKADDPKELKRELATLKAQLAKASQNSEKKGPTEIDQGSIDRAVAKALADQAREFGKTDDKRFRIVERAQSSLAKRADQLDGLVSMLRVIASEELGAYHEVEDKASTNGRAEPLPATFPDHIDRHGTGHFTVKATAKDVRVTPKNDNVARHGSRPRNVPDGSFDAGDLPKGERAILTAAAQYPDGATREQLTILTGYKRSTRDAYIQRLSERGLAQWDATSRLVFATSAGIAMLGDGFEPLPTGTALRAHWLTRLPVGESIILEYLIDHYPKSVDRENISAVTEFKRSTRDAYIQRLGTRKLITTDRDGVRAADTLFED